jgi:hypothetical protein
VATTSHHAIRVDSLRKRRVAVAERAWRAFAARNPSTVVHLQQSTEFMSLRSPTSTATSCASRRRCFRRLALVDQSDVAIREIELFGSSG